VIEKGAFPSDQYAVASQARFHGFPDAVLESEEPLRTLIERDDVALALIGNVNYLTGRSYDMPALVHAAHQKGALIGFDLAHGAGNLLLSLHDDGPDFAVWCNYKYLNAGPGGLGGVFVHERHASSVLPRFEGWWGHDKGRRFEMAARFSPIRGAEGWQVSNPPILQLAALRASMELFDRAGMAALRRKGDGLTGYLEFLLRERNAEVLTPRDRGSMLTVRFRRPDIVGRLKERGAVVDLRPPDIVRITPAPLYNSFADVQRLATLVAELGDA
jgi:kynureninase